MSELRFWGIVKAVLYELQPVRVIDIITFVQYVYRSAFDLGSFSLIVSDFVYQRLFTLVTRLGLRTWLLIGGWVIGWALMIKAGFGSLWILLSMIASIFLNLGKKKRGEMSAYSVFNEGFKQLLGTMNADQLDDEIRHNVGRGGRMRHDIVQLDDVLDGLDDGWDDMPAPAPGRNQRRRQNQPNNNDDDQGNQDGEGVGNAGAAGDRGNGERVRKKGKKARRTYEKRLQRRRGLQEQLGGQDDGEDEGEGGEGGWEAHDHLLDEGARA